MADKIFYSQDGIVITSSRVTIGGDNYFVNQIVSSYIHSTDELESIGNKFVLPLGLGLTVIVTIAFVVRLTREFFTDILGVIWWVMTAILWVPVAGIILFIGFLVTNLVDKAFRSDFNFTRYHLTIEMTTREKVAIFNSRDPELVQTINNAIFEALASRS